MNHDVETKKIESAIQNYIDPYFQQDLITLNKIKSIELTSEDEMVQNAIKIKIDLGFPSIHYFESLKKTLQEEIARVSNKTVLIENISTLIAHQVQRGLKPLANIKNIIVVSSAKGGVGKSTTAINLALSLRHEGANVGILDADIYGPSLPKMINHYEKPSSKDGKTLDPIMAYGLQTMSIGYLIEDKDPAIWRAPMAVQALLQLLSETNWNNLDYLVMDLPPGTGDIQLTLSQKIPIAGAIIITTPQDLAMIDARKGLNMFKKMNVPILGVLENMSTHQCSKCGHEEAIFGEDGGINLSQETETRFLGKMPLDIRIRQEIDQGCPTVAKDPNSLLSLKYRELAISTMAQLSLQPKDYAKKMPNIIVE